VRIMEPPINDLITVCLSVIGTGVNVVDWGSFFIIK